MRRRTVLLWAALLCTTPACASRYEVDAEPPTYAAQAKIRVKEQKDGNRDISIRVDHLAPPARIDPSFRAYVVWFSVPGHGITKAGRLRYHEGRRRGRLGATTPHVKLELIVTIEQDPATPTPSDRVIVRKIVSG